MRPVLSFRRPSRWLPSARHVFRLVLYAIILFAMGLVTALLVTCTSRPTPLDQISRIGTLRVATINSATTYYLDKNGPKGLQYDLVNGFAKTLDVPLKMVVYPNRGAVLKAVKYGSAQLGVGLALDYNPSRAIRFTPPYMDHKVVAVYRSGQSKPGNLDDLSGKLTLPAQSVEARWLRARHPDVQFKTERNVDTTTLLKRVNRGKLYATFATQGRFARNRLYYPKLRRAFTVPKLKRRAVWAFRRNGHTSATNSLYKKAVAYLEHVQNTGRLHILRDRYLSQTKQLGFVGGAKFARQVDTRLSHWRKYFKQAAKKTGVDWRLLAAIGYQESHWDRNAVSPTTVRGIMMLTRSTARQMGIDNRRNPRQSIDGGARYFLAMRERLPKAIKQPDRTWFALAAYNMGFGHVMDARRLLEARDQNPNLWVNLRKALPWLSQQRYLEGTRYGYAHGRQAAIYVGNIRAYYDILLWMTDKKHNKKPDVLKNDSRPDTTPNQNPAGIKLDTPAF